TSTNPAASITVNAVEITTPAGGIRTQPCTSCTPVVGGLTSFVILNPEGTVPTLVDPDGAATGISNVELYNSTLTNPNPSNPNPSNPNPSNTNLSDQPVSDATYTVTNTGDTSASYHVALAGQDPGHSLQMIIAKAYETPTVSSNANGTPGCALVTQTQIIVQSNIINPVVNPNPSNASLSDPGITDPSDSNVTFQLRPREQAFITLRGFDVSNDPTQWLSLLN